MFQGEVQGGVLDGHKVAIKTVSSRTYEEKHVRDSFLWEAKRLDVVRHPFVVQYLGLLQDGVEVDKDMVAEAVHNLEMVLEFCEGGTLEDEIRALHPQAALVETVLDYLRDPASAHAVQELLTPHLVPEVLPAGIHTLHDPLVHTVLEFLGDTSHADLVQELLLVRGVALHGIHARIWQLLLELVTAVDAIHGLGMIHMDLKSENVLLSCKGRQGHVKLADMGVAQTDDAMKGDDEKRPEVVEQRIKDRWWASPEELGVTFEEGEPPICLLFRLLCSLTCRGWQKRTRRATRRPKIRTTPTKQ